MKKRFRLLAFTLMLVMIFGSIPVQASSFGLSKNKVTINIGDSYDLDVTETDKTPRWTTWGINKVKVDQDGVVTGIRAGKTTVSARIGLAVKKCTVTVVDPTIILNKKTAIIYTGGTSVNAVQLKATNKGATKEVAWSTSNPEVAVVDEKGKVTSVAAGTATITAIGNKETATCEIIVKDSTISLNHDSMVLSDHGAGSSITLKANVVGSKKAVKWTTSDKRIATVKNGKVTGKTPGTAIITATANGVSATCMVEVKENFISINEEKALLYAGETKQLKTNAGKKAVVIWESSDETVATVDEKGKVTAIGKGTAVISVGCSGIDLQNPVKGDTCVITVKETETKIGENVIELKTKGKDKTYKLGYEVTGRNNVIKWTTSDKKVATVSNGKVTAKKAGTATITATANGVSDTVVVNVKDYDPTITLNLDEYTLYTGKGNVVTLKAKVDGAVKKTTWNSSNTAVATVNSKGKVTALREGQTIITASANGVSDECLITVMQTETKPERENIFLRKGEKAEIPADIIGNSQTITYKTSNKKVATVKKGIITAKNNGQADIKVIANGVTAICHVYVGECVHTFDEGTITTEPTCQKTGIRTRTCTICGDTCVETVAKTDHAFDEGVVIEAKCTTSGTKTYTCTMCDYTKQEMIAPAGHTYGEWTVVTESTETTDGIEKQYCSVCNAENSRKIPYDLHKHEFTPVVTEPTCTEAGYTTYTCACGESYTDTYKDALGHEFGEWTVSENGIEEVRTCIRCPETETRKISDSDHKHDYQSAVTEPTCTEKGYTTYTCACGDTYTDDEVDALGHEFGEWTTTKEPTEDTAGEKTRTCKRCPETETEKISPLNHTHNYQSVVTEPTCTEKGYTTHKCACGYEYVDTYVDATGHSYGEYATTKEATCTAEGSKERTCSACGNVETASITMLGHDYSTEYTVDKEATCTEDGSKSQHCSRCEAKQNVTSIPATGHYAVDGYCTVCKERIAGLYDANGDLVATWEESGIDVAKDYSENSSNANYYQTATTSAYYVLTNVYKTAKKVVIPEGTTSIGSCAFYNCTGLTNITIPDGVTLINLNVFAACTGLTNITIPDGVTEIYYSAFNRCTGLTSLYIPSNVEKIWANSSTSGPFIGCSNLSKIYCGASKRQSGWDTYWNYYTSSKSAKVTYNVTREEYEANYK